MSENRDLARSLLAAARRRSNRFKLENEERSAKKISEKTTTNENYQGPELLNDSTAELIAERGWRERVKDKRSLSQMG